MSETDASGQWMNLGMTAFRAGRSQESIDAFQRAASLNPLNVEAHLFLALATSPQYIPGDESAENEALGAQIETAFRQAVELDPRHWTARVLYGHHLTNEERFLEAEAMFRRALDLETGKADVWFAASRARFHWWVAGGKPAAEREHIIRDLEQIASLDPLHDAAMEYIALMLRESGSRDRSEVWMKAAADARSEKMQRSFAHGTQWLGEPSESGDLLRQWAEAMLTPLPPLAPPPPPDPRLSWPDGSSGAIFFDPVSKEARDRPRPIRVPPDVQATKLIRRVEPVIPGDPFAENELRFVVVIGVDGFISKDVLISGNRWLERFGHYALRQWLFQPTLVNGNPVEVVTEVRVSVRN